MDFGNFTDTFTTRITAGVAAGLSGATRTDSADIREHVFRIGVNYQFGSYPLVAYK
jgi:hypothetical protein